MTKAAKAKVCKQTNKAVLTTVFKKKRNVEPGIRHQGGRIYDSENGTSCHQCRQKTLEVKAACTSPRCNLHWCPRCLTNRYNEEVDTVRALKKWTCPKCRKICNCSNCRKKQGLQATGILANIAKSAGFGSVSQLLEKNPKMSVWTASKKRGLRGKDAKENTKGKSKASKARTDKKMPGEDVGAKKYGGVDDYALKKRSAPMPAHANPQIHMDGARLEIPASLDAAKLVCVLEFFSIFSSTIGVPHMSISALAKELTSHDLAEAVLGARHEGREASFLVGALVALKDIICKWFGVENADPHGMAWDSWLPSRYSVDTGSSSQQAGLTGPSQTTVRPPAEIDIEASGATETRATRRARNVRGSNTSIISNASIISNQSTSASRLASFLGRRVKVFWPGENDWFTGTVRRINGNGKMLVVYDDDDETWEDVEGSAIWRFDDQKSGLSFWSMDVADRLEMVNMVIHDSLQCGPIVDVIEKSIEDVGECQRRHKEEMERVRKEICDEKERHKQRFIAELISSQQISNISAETQQEILATARQNALSSVSEENMSRLRWLKTSQFFRNCDGRKVAIGQDRTGLCYFSLSCAEVITGSSKGLICMSEDSVRCFGEEDIERLVDALDVSGENEGALRMGLEFYTGHMH